MINKVTLIGHIGQDPELKRLDSGTEVCRISVATTESYKDKDGEWQNLTSWHNVILWRDLAVSATLRLKKGHKVYIDGKINYRTQEKDGIKYFYTDIVANTFRSLEKAEKHDHFPTQEPPQSSQHRASTPDTGPDIQFAVFEANDKSASAESNPDLPF